MEQPARVHNSDHINNLSASSYDDLLECPTAFPQSASTAGMSQLSILPTDDSSLNNSSTRGDGSHLSSSMVNSRLQLRLEMVLIAVQIVASAVVLALSNLERSQTLFRELIISYVILCIAALSLLYWDFCSLDHTPEQDSDISFNIRFQRIILFETFLSFLMEEDVQRTFYRTRSDLYSESLSTMQLLVNSSRILLNIFFGYWLMISCIQITHETSSPSSDALILYWLTVLLFAYGCFEHVMALFVFTVPSLSEVLSKQLGASSEMINTLPTHQVKLKRDTSGNDGGAASNSEKGGVVAANTDLDRVNSGEDAVCSICLGIYADNDELRELPCSHLLHKDCVDKWLNIKATCPLCMRMIR